MPPLVWAGMAFAFASLGWVVIVLSVTERAERNVRRKAPRRKALNDAPSDLT